MRRGTRARDDELIARLYGADMRVAEELEESGNELAAMRRYRSIATTFGGVWPVDEPARRAERLEPSAEVKRAIKEETRCDRFEARRVHEFDEVMADLRFAEDEAFASNLERDFRVSELQRRAEGDGCEAVTAQRLLDTAYAFTSFYLPRDFFEEGRYERAAASFEVAVAIKPDNPIVWYNLACARARAGDKNEAVEALRQSIDHGFRNLEQIESDSDLDSIRARDDYREVVRALREEDSSG
jgi:tetratricopeptide (TPR) repeat protein